MPSMIVAGAGTAGVNGTYTETGTYNSKPYYNLSGTATNLYCIAWSLAVGGWAIHYDMTGIHYYYAFGGDTPDLAGSWGANWGAAPAPTVTAASEAVTKHLALLGVGK